ncbi:MAG: FG-GAP-like repeat-containing protein [Nitrospirota bacterium]
MICRTGIKNKVLIPGMIALMAAGFFIAASSYSSAAIVRLASITGSYDPSRIALDAGGKIYVTETSRDRLLIFNRNGEPERMMGGLSEPIGVAVDAGGRIYIGNSGTNSVDVYGEDLEYRFSLGKGNGEVSKPNDIAVSGDGRIFVTDSKEHKVKVYSSDGTALFSFGGWGKDNGQFNVPSGIAIDEQAGELYVTDLGIFNDPQNGDTAGARVQVFGLDGVYKRSFGEYGTGDGKLIRPLGIALDSEGKVYITDSLQAVVHIFDGYGNSIGTIYDLDNPMKTPIGIAIGEDNRIFIASLNTSSVEIYGLDDYTFLTVTPKNLEYTAQGGINPGTQTITIGNTGAGSLDWSIQSESPWITVNQVSGILRASETVQVSIGVNVQGLGVGLHTGQLTIRSPGAAETVGMELEILPSPILEVTPASLSFKGQANGSQPGTQTLKVKINNDINSQSAWTAESSSSWLTIIPATGGSVETASSVMVNTTGLPAGVHNGNITITSAGVTGSPATVGVTLTLISAGNIEVTTNLESATFTITGPENYEGSGMSWNKADAPVGQYTITFGSIQGYRKPASRVFTVSTGQTSAITGQYRDMKAGKKIIAGLGSGLANPAEVKIVTADGSDAETEFTAFTNKYGANTAAGDIDGDGIDEIIVSPGSNRKNPARVKIFRADGTEMPGLDFIALGTKFGAGIAAADLDGDGKAEIIVGAGIGKGNYPEVRVFAYDGIKIIDTGIYFISDTGRYGVYVAAGDIDGDGKAEIITGPGPDDRTIFPVRVWKADASSGTGKWRVLEKLNFTAFRGNKGVVVTTGDLNGDGADEIITGESTGSEIKVFRGDGTPYGVEFTGTTKHRGMSIAAGDTNTDGIAEIIVGAGPFKKNPSEIRIYNADGVFMNSLMPFDRNGGVNVGLGRLD